MRQLAPVAGAIPDARPWGTSESLESLCMHVTSAWGTTRGKRGCAVGSLSGAGECCARLEDLSVSCILHTTVPSLVGQRS